MLALLLLLAALVLVLLGQFYFFHRSDYLWDGLVFHGAAVACFLLAWRQIRRRQPRSGHRWSIDWGTWLRDRPAQVVLLALGLFLSLGATLLSHGRTGDQPTGDVVLPWVVALGAVALATLWPGTWSRSIRRDWRAHLRSMSWRSWAEVLTVTALTLLAFLLRASALGRVPYTLGGDEAWHGLLARQVLSGQLGNPFVMGYMSMPTFFYWPLSWSLWLAGNDMVGLRLPAALIGTATVPLLYLLARDLWGRRVALLSALFLATYDYHIHYSRLGANNVWDPAFVLLTLWLLDRGLAKEGGDAEGGTAGRDGTRFFMLAGLAMGLGFYFYTGARLLPVLAAACVAFVWLKKRRRIVGLGRRLVLLALVFVVVAGPMLGYALTHPDEWNARINQVGIIQSGWLAREPGLTGKGTLQILAEQFLRAAGAFHVFPDRTVWYGADRPLLGFLAGAFAVLGMAWAVAHWRERRYFLVLIWFWAVIVTGGMLTESPPSSQRLVIAIPAVALLVTVGLEQTVRLGARLLSTARQGANSGVPGNTTPGFSLARLLRGKGGLRERRENVVLGLLIAVLAVSSVRFYFGEYTPSRRYGSQNGETATMIGHYLHDLDGDYDVYFFGAPRIYWSFGTMAFLAPRLSARDVVEPLAAPPDFVDTGRSAVFIFLPERSGELAWVQQAYPDGTLREFRDAEGGLRFIAYQVPRSRYSMRVLGRGL
jgi:4-amino-4-deoxy-L-arabinose transferase-like glycosyltransferase